MTELVVVRKLARLETPSTNPPVRAGVTRLCCHDPAGVIDRWGWVFELNAALELHNTPQPWVDADDLPTAVCMLQLMPMHSLDKALADSANLVLTVCGRPYAVAPVHNSIDAKDLHLAVLEVHAPALVCL